MFEFLKLFLEVGIEEKTTTWVWSTYMKRQLHHSPVEWQFALWFSPDFIFIWEIFYCVCLLLSSCPNNLRLTLEIIDRKLPVPLCRSPFSFVICIVSICFEMTFLFYLHQQNSGKPSSQPKLRTRIAGSRPMTPVTSAIKTAMVNVIEKRSAGKSIGIQDKVEFWSCNRIGKETLWNHSEKVDHLAYKYWCVLQGSGSIKMIKILAQSW